MFDIILYGAKWCGACKSMAPMVEKLAEETGARYVYYDTEEHVAQAIDDHIYTVPTIIIERDGLEVARGGTMSRDGIMQMMRSA